MLSIASMSNLTCADSIEKTSTQHDSDRIICGDSFGHIILMDINISDVSGKNSKPSLMDPQKRIIEMDTSKRLFVKKRIHDQAVTKIQYITELSAFVSCSTSETVSLVIEDLYKFETTENAKYVICFLLLLIPQSLAHRPWLINIIC